MVQGGPPGGGREDPVRSSEDSGDGWHRLPDEPLDRHYGEPLRDHWDFPDDPVDQNRIMPPIDQMISDPKAPYGRDSSGNAYTKEQYAERFNTLGPEGEQWANFPGNGGAVPGTRVAYTDAAKFQRDYGSRLDRIGVDTGKYLALMKDGNPASWEQRAIHVGSLSS